MIKCICIDDSKKPKQVPDHKWIKKGEQYHVIFTLTVLPQKQLAFELHEITLDESCHPFEYFAAKRFAFTPNAIQELNELIKSCSEIDFSIEELTEQIHERTADTV